MSENIDSSADQGARSFLLNPFGGNAIKGSKLEADQGPSTLSIAFGSEAINMSENIDSSADRGPSPFC